MSDLEKIIKADKDWLLANVELDEDGVPTMVTSPIIAWHLTLVDGVDMNPSPITVAGLWGAAGFREPATSIVDPYGFIFLSETQDTYQCHLCWLEEAVFLRYPDTNITPGSLHDGGEHEASDEEDDEGGLTQLTKSPKKKTPRMH